MNEKNYNAGEKITKIKGNKWNSYYNIKRKYFNSTEEKRMGNNRKCKKDKDKEDKEEQGVTKRNKELWGMQELLWYVMQ